MAPPPATAASNRFGKYSMVARLATGGMAEIFLARLHGAAGFEKLVCIKRILPHLARNPQFVAMFLSEARIAARISHPNVCQVFELGEIDGSYYLAMEYLEGLPLAFFRRLEGRLDPRLVAGIAVQACEGLHHAHQLKNTDGSVMEVVHRDVSPQNLFVTTDGVVKVLDFGIAKIHQDTTAGTTKGGIKGTYAYMSPEQLRGERLDRRTDVFAMGIAMWETLTGRFLFRRDTDFLIFQAIAHDPIEDIRAARPDLPPAFGGVIMTALGRSRDERYPTARALGEAIAAAIPPLGGAAIAEQLAHAFPGVLADQADVVRIARDGGSFDLDVERGPAASAGAESLTTPVSNLRESDPVAWTSGGAARTVISSPGAVETPITAAPGTAAPATAAPGTGVSAAPVGPLPSVMTAAAPAPPRRSWRPVVVAAVSLATGGVAALVYGLVTHSPPRGAHEPANLVVATDRADAHPDAAAVELSEAQSPGAAPSASPHTAAPIDASVPSDAGAAEVPADTRPPAPEPRRAPSIDKPAAGMNDKPSNKASDRPSDKSSDRAPSASVTRPQTGSPAKPSGPPGFITIDSAPVYAVVYIDGKSYGETPLVRIELPPGRHTVHAVSSSGATRDIKITIESGKVAPLSRILW